MTRMLRPTTFSLLFLGCARALFAQATVEGTVQLPPVSANFGFNQRYSTSGDNPAPANNPPAAVVYLEGNFGGPEKQKAPEVMSQKNLSFSPDLVAVPVGGAVIFPNEDDLYHNVFSYSKTKRFDLGRYRKHEKAVPVIFDKPGAVTIHCEIHEAMRATVLVLESPHFIKTDSNGRYRLTNLPAGHYVLKAWVDAGDVRQRPIDLTSGATVHVDFPAR